MSTQNPIDQLGQRAQVVPVYIRALVAVVCLGLSTFWIITNSGVYFWAAEFQANNLFDGEHYYILSGLIAVLVPLLPAALLMQLVLAPIFIKKQVDKQGQSKAG